MSVLGIISEYNPFHNGHLYHLQESKRVTGSQYSVCVMSGNFIQRGEPAIVDKWSRTKMALECGIDLVLELPLVYALSTAELFAFGSVNILDSLGIVDNISFGSEAGDINILCKIADVLVNEPSEYATELKDNLAKGISFASARSNALSKIFNDENLDEVLSSSNNILAIEYLKVLKRINSTITPYTIKRLGNQYNSNCIDNNFASATSIRQSIIDAGNTDAIKNAVPSSTLRLLNEEFELGKGPITSEIFSQTIISILRKMNLEELQSIFDVNEGLENRIKDAAAKSSSIEQLIDAIKTKRYTQTRIQRILYHALIGINKGFYCELSANGGPQYIRVLGFNENGKNLLNAAKKKATLPIITKVADYKNNDNHLLNQMLQYDITATNIYNLAYKNSQYRIGNVDYTHQLEIYK